MTQVISFLTTAFSIIIAVAASLPAVTVKGNGAWAPPEGWAEADFACLQLFSQETTDFTFVASITSQEVRQTPSIRLPISQPANETLPSKLEYSLSFTTLLNMSFWTGSSNWVSTPSVSTPSIIRSKFLSISYLFLSVSECLELLSAISAPQAPLLTAFTKRKNADSRNYLESMMNAWTPSTLPAYTWPWT